MQTRRIGKNGPEVSAVGLGCMGMSWAYGPADDKESIATIHAALDAGINLLDTGEFYGMGHNETLINRALAGRKRENVFISLKFGAQFAPDGSYAGFDARPSSVKNFLSYSLRRLGTDYVDLYQPARVDREVPIEETVGAIAELIQAGYVRYAGLSEASSETVRRAKSVHSIAALQIEYAMVTRGIEREILPALRESGVGVVAYGVLSRGLLSGNIPGRDTARLGDFRPHLPRFQGENLQHNLKLIDDLSAIASEKNATVPQLAIAWALARGEDIIPLIGSRRREQLEEALGALEVKLTDEDMKRIDQIAPPGAIKGDRYQAAQMAALDSEREM